MRYIPFLFLIAAWLTGCPGIDYVNDPVVRVAARIELDPPNSAIEVGNELTLEAVYFDSSGVSVSGTDFTWQSDNPKVAEVDSNGRLVGHAPGQVRVRAGALGAWSEPALVTVYDQPDGVVLIQLTPESARLRTGRTTAIAARALDAQSSELAGVFFVWRSDEPSVASVDESGRVTAHSPGSARITASASGLDSPASQIMVVPAIREGTFEPLPNGEYEIYGTVQVEDRDDGTAEVRFESDFEVSLAPRLTVFLSTTSRPNSGSLEVGDVGSHLGAQEFQVPSGADVADYSYVVVHCVPLNVVIGFAELR